jgi:predicted cupin superfamily sugar epimerase
VTSTAADLIKRHALAPHPEGGWYRRIYTSALQVSADARKRPAITSILYLLQAGETSRWHRVLSDELWHFHDGAPLELLCADDGFEGVQRLRLGPSGAQATDKDPVAPLQAIAAGCWQAARSMGAFTLVGCSVAPGFDFEDFVLLADTPRAAAQLRARWPAYAEWV